MSIRQAQKLPRTRFKSQKAIIPTQTKQILVAKPTSCMSQGLRSCPSCSHSQLLCLVGEHSTHECCYPHPQTPVECAPLHARIIALRPLSDAPPRVQNMASELFNWRDALLSPHIFESQASDDVSVLLQLEPDDATATVSTSLWRTK